MPQNVGTFSLYLDLHIDTKNAIRRLQGVEFELRKQINQIFNSLNKGNYSDGLNSVLEKTFDGTPAVLGKLGTSSGLSFGNAVLAGITSILTSAAVLGVVERAFSSLKEFVTNAFLTGIETEKQGIAFRVLLGDSEKAKRLFKEINDLAVKTPFNIADLREITKRLLGYGFAVEEVAGITKMLGDIAAGTGGDLKLLAKAYGQVRTLGKVYAEELNQFAEQGVALRELLAKNRGISVQELVRGMDTGKIVITFEEFRQVFEDLYKSKFMNLMAEQADTLGGRLQNLSETFSLLGQELIGIDTLTGKVKAGSLFDLISKILFKLLNFIRAHSTEIQEFFNWAAKELTQPFKDLGITTKDITTGLKLLLVVLVSLFKLSVQFFKFLLYFSYTPLKAITLLRDNITKFQNELAGLFNSFVTVMAGVKAVTESIKQMWGSLLSGDWQLFLQNFNQVFSLLTVLVKDFATKLIEFWPAVTNFWKSQITGLANWFLSAFGWNLDLLKQKFIEIFGGIITNLQNQFWSLISLGFWFNLGFNLGSQIGSGLYNAMISAVENIKVKISQLLSQVNQSISQIGNFKFKFKLPGFASGGSFVVDGVPGIDKNLVAFWATKGERVIVQTPQEQNIDNRKYIQKTIIYTTQAKQFWPIFMR